MHTHTHTTYNTIFTHTHTHTYMHSYVCTHTQIQHHIHKHTHTHMTNNTYTHSGMNERELPPIALNVNTKFADALNLPMIWATDAAAHPRPGASRVHTVEEEVEMIRPKDALKHVPLAGIICTEVPRARLEPITEKVCVLVCSNYVLVCSNYVLVRSNYVLVCSNYVLVCSNYVLVCSNYVLVMSCTGGLYVCMYVLVARKFLAEGMSWLHRTCVCVCVYVCVLIAMCWVCSYCTWVVCYVKDFILCRFCAQVSRKSLFLRVFLNLPLLVFVCVYVSLCTCFVCGVSLYMY
jgi:hypothetical protein